jgi:AraC family transcriptional activator of pyochelin receptor
MKSQYNEEIIETCYGMVPPTEPGNGNRYGQYTIQSSTLRQQPWFNLEHPRPGMSLCICNYTPPEDVLNVYEVGEGSIAFTIVLSGNCENQTKQGHGDQAVSVHKPCEMAMLTDHCSGVLRFKRNTAQQYVHLILQRDLLRTLMVEHGKSPQAMLDKINNRGGVYVLDQTPLSPKVQLIASEMLHCPLTGLNRKLFLEGNSLLLLAQFLDRFGGGANDSACPLSQSDVERLHEARRILLQNLVEPPTIRQLARHIGLNEFKLKKGFHELFGCTVYNCLRNQRMHTARSLLLDSDMTVSSAAADVGYINVSHFIRAFKKQFGVTPGSLLYHSRRNHGRDS